MAKIEKRTWKRGNCYNNGSDDFLAAIKNDFINAFSCPFLAKGLFIQNATAAWRRSRRYGRNKTN